MLAYCKSDAGADELNGGELAGGDHETPLFAHVAGQENQRQPPTLEVAGSETTWRPGVTDRPPSSCLGSQCVATIRRV
jgi:hypothetical protein